ncbi:hypothetical protein WJX73_009682 [Symbiochloris irregularis]|uniref:S1 motif domain-containing protein n=1 Tax=Symbiochloris irregularis TaxID=706552 RepID=A0AAW1NTC5_9CHLO
MLSAWGTTLFARSAFKSVSQLCARGLVTESARLTDLAVHLDGLNEPAYASVLQLIRDTRAQEAPPPLGQAEEAFRRHNSSLPRLEGQCVYGKIIKVERKFVWVDVGIRGYTRIAKKELRFTQLVASRRGGGQRKGISDFRIGDVMTFFIEDLETPFGDMMLTATGQAAQNDKGHAVWDALSAPY